MSGQVGTAIRRRIAQKEREGVTRYQISKLSGVPEATLSRFIRGHAGLNLDTIERLCPVLELEMKVRRGTRR